MNALDHYVHSVGFDVCIPGVSADRVRHDVDSFLATLDRDIDPDSISIVPDSTDSPPLNVVQLIIKLGV